MDWTSELLAFLSDPERKELNGNSYATKKIDGLIIDFGTLNLDPDDILRPKRIVDFHFSNVTLSSLMYRGNLTFQSCLFGEQDEGFKVGNNVNVEKFICNMLHFSNCSITSRLSLSKIDSNTLFFSTIPSCTKTLYKNIKP